MVSEFTLKTVVRELFGFGLVRDRSLLRKIS